MYPVDMPALPRNVPHVLIIRDGWGENPHPEHDAFNAVKLAKTPVAAFLDAHWPRTLVATSGEDVGLPEGTMGNSEVGHQNIGAGRIVDQDSVAITKACRAGLDKNQTLVDAVRHAKQHNTYVHLMGICSDAGVHGMLNHLYALLRLCAAMSHSKVAVHLFTDGRDTGPYTGKAFIEQVEAKLKETGVGAIASVMGRYWAMDRDNRWERVERAYVCLTGRGARRAELPIVASATQAVQNYYDAPSGETMKGDEFVTPTMVGKDLQDALSRRITNNDSVIFYNYRGDRPRELIQAFRFDPFDGSVAASPDSGRQGFDRGPKLELHFVTMAEYWDALNPYVHVAFRKPPKFVNIMAETISKSGLTQFHCAETEKYPHVTFFYNDYREEPFPGETREIIQSPKVSTYDLKPEMSARGVCDAVLGRLSSEKPPDYIVVNFANGDMVGHTGNLAAAIKACEVVDGCVGEIVQKVLNLRGSAIVTADHGNAEQMFDPTTNAPHTAHTTYTVPLYVIGEPFVGRKLRAGGRLADIAPTSLEMMGLPKPAEMTGESLLA
jgi:2,3-bisphosphoglycerate-independent phosphoglycerate mutase